MRTAHTQQCHHQSTPVYRLAIIVPSGQATSFLLNQYKDRKLSVTSFLDQAFSKNLESALRFGTPLLVQDVEHLDPIVNAALNKEPRRAGGRVFVRIGSQDIDFSSAFASVSFSYFRLLVLTPVLQNAPLDEKSLCRLPCRSRVSCDHGQFFGSSKDS